MKTARLIVVVIAAILAIIVIAQNTESVETRLLFATITMPRAILLVLTLLIGFVLGAVSAVWMRRSGAKG
ncbi:MAG: LapA family protein [Phycisphaerales bacterium]|nr:LapA family protein [Phycisphaerales bacterium]NNM24833.1 LapA family protein [Phycisphaerales bacterium]